MLGEAGVRANHGAVVSVRGSVVDIRFDEHLPPIDSLLRAGEGEAAHLATFNRAKAQR